MNTHASFQPSDTESVVAVLRNAFTASEGADEGKAIAGLTRDLINSTPGGDLLGYVAKGKSENIIGAIFFSRYSVAGDESVYILSPVGVCPSAQHSGIGQNLITFGLNDLRHRGVDVALVYGDPDYYIKVGFQPLNTNTIPAPFKLSQPHGWMGQALNADEITPRSGEARCVDALHKPHFW